MFVKKGLTFLFTTALAISQAAAQVNESAQRAELKKQIREVALANINNTTNRAEVRQVLNGLIAQLAALQSPVAAADLATLNQGAWRQIWADESNPEPPGFSQDFSQVYQTITAEGIGFNFGLRRGPNFETLFILKVAATLNGNVATAEITEAYSRTQPLQSSEDLMALSYEILAGKADGVVKRNAGRFPNGPIGAKSDLTVLYLDQDLKIGTAPNAYSGFVELFILERVVRPAL